MKKITIYYSMSNPSSNLYDQYTRKCVYVYIYYNIQCKTNNREYIFHICESTLKTHYTHLYLTQHSIKNFSS